MKWAVPHPAGALLQLRIVPRAPRDEVAGVQGDTLKIRLQAPPVDGEANAALVRFLAWRLEVSRAAVQILSGATSRQKRVLVAGRTLPDVERLLEQR